ncbi:MAG: dihydrolipoamide acetyltransferase family protein [Nitrososphaerota archaeon]
MVTEVVMPKMGDTMKTGKIVKWLKQEGERVAKGEPLLEIETEKATIEVESRASGILKKILAQNGEEVPVISTIAYIVQEGESLPEELVSKPPQAAAEYIEKTSPASKGEEKPEEKTVARIKASPLAKKIAEEKGVDLSQVTGTGPEGRITREDVLRYLESKPVTPKAVQAVEKMGQVAAPEFQVVPMSSMRRAIAAKMTESKTRVPHFYLTTQVDLTEAAKMRENLIPAIEAKTGVRLSLTHLLVRAVALALKEFPQLNSTLDGENVRQWRDVNIGIAVSLEDGLIVPVLRAADKLSLVDIAVEASKLVEKAREKKLREEEFSGGTFTISNMGTLDVESFIPIINVPETAILGVGKVSDKPAVVNGQIAIRKIVNITLSADHRVVDGVLAAKFLQRIKNLLEAPYNLILTF